MIGGRENMNQHEKEKENDVLLACAMYYTNQHDFARDPRTIELIQASSLAWALVQADYPHVNAYDCSCMAHC